MANRDALKLRQLEALQRLLAEIHAGPNAFYQARVPQRVESIADFIRQVPFTTKAELVEDHAIHSPFGSNLTEPLDHYTRFHQTSGTSGAPLAWLDTPKSWLPMLDGWRRVLEMSGVRAGDRVLFAFSFGPFLGFWTAFEAAAQLGCLCIPGGGLSSEARLETIARTGATVLCCTPTYALRLGETAGGRALPIRRIIVAGEPGGSLPATRARIESRWPGSSVHDHHGMTEVGPVTYEVPGSPGNLAILEEHHLAEIVDPETGTEVIDGETGELVLTTLQRNACPLLRYRTGDLVRRQQFDIEGQSLLGLAGGILGRLDDMVIVRGVNIYPSAIESVVRKFDDVTEFQVLESARESMTELEVQIESHRPATPGELEAALRETFNLRIPVAAVPAHSLPRHEFKSRRWVKQPVDS